MAPEKITGLPAHPLLVHIPVMAIPLCAILVLAYLLRPQWRHGLIYPTAVLVVITMVATVLAAGSGERLEETLSASDRRSPLLHQAH